MARRRRRRLKHRNFIFGVIAMIVSVVLLYSLGANIYRVYNQQVALNNLEKQRDALLEEKEQLEEEVALLNDEDYVVRYAREHYIFSKDGQEVATLPESKE